jgi:hypothetical protein
MIAGCGSSGEPDVSGPVTPSPTGPPSSASPASTSTSTATTTEAIDWDADLDALDEGVRRIHPNPFWRVSEEEWDERLADARQRLPTLSRREAEMVLFELTALIDGHSGIHPFDVGYHLYAIRLYHFTDGYFVVDSQDPTAVGGQVLTINEVPVEEAVARVTPLVAHDNDKTIEVALPMYLITPEILGGLGIVDDVTRPHFEVRRSDGTLIVLDPGIAEWGPYTDTFGGSPVGLPQAPEPMSQSRRDEEFWWTTIEDPAGGGDVLYFQYNEVRSTSPSGPLSAVVDEMRQRIDAGGVRRVIVDVRHNPGGDNTTYFPLLDLLLDPSVDQPGGLYVIIGRQTFSAATNFTTELDVRSSAVFVGEPTGGRPNLYGDVRPVWLPSSDIQVNVSSRYWEMSTPDDLRPWIPADIPVELSSDEYFAHQDTVLEAALAA